MRLVNIIWLVGILIIVFPAQSQPVAERAAPAKLPKGTYAFSNHPDCGTESPIATVLRDPQVQASIAAINPKAGAIVIAVSAANDGFMQAGGDLAGAFRKLSGQPSRSSCATVCVRGEPGWRATSIYASRKDGAEKGTQIPLEGVSILDSLDHTGWRGIVGFVDANNTPTVCGTATSWDASVSVTKYLRVGFNEKVGGCGNYSRVVGTTAVDRNPTDFWDGQWDFKSGVLQSRHRNSGTVVTGSISGQCTDASVYFTATHQDGSSCTCNLARKPSGSASVDGTCTCPGTGVFMKGTLQ